MLLHRSLPADQRAGNLCPSREPQILQTANPVAPTTPVTGNGCHVTARRESVDVRSRAGSLILVGHWGLLVAAWARRAYSTRRHWGQGGAVSWAELAREAYFVENYLPTVDP